MLLFACVWRRCPLSTRTTTWRSRRRASLTAAVAQLVMKPLGCDGFSGMRTDGPERLQERLVGDVGSSAMLRPHHEIVDRDDPDESLLLIEHWQSPNPVLPHRPECGASVVSRRAGMKRATRHHVSNPYLRWKRRPRGRRDADVAIGDHADDPSLLVNDWHDPAVTIPHDLGCRRKIGVPVARSYVGCLKLLHRHGYTPLLLTAQSQSALLNRRSGECVPHWLLPKPVRRAIDVRISVIHRCKPSAYAGRRRELQVRRVFQRSIADPNGLSTLERLV
jgi:hypothetical protein